MSARPGPQPRNRPQHEPAYAAVCELVRRWRAERGLTQNQLAERLGTGQTTVQRIERGDRRIDVVELTILAEALGLDPMEALEQALRAISDLPHRWRQAGHSRTRKRPRSTHDAPKDKKNRP